MRVVKSWWNTWRYRAMLTVIVNELETARRISYARVDDSNIAKEAGDKSTAEMITEQLHVEAKIFFPIQQCISDFCNQKGIKDPFRL